METLVINAAEHKTLGTPWSDEELQAIASFVDVGGYTLTDVGGLLGLTRERVRQLCERVRPKSERPVWISGKAFHIVLGLRSDQTIRNLNQLGRAYGRKAFVVKKKLEKRGLWVRVNSILNARSIHHELQRFQAGQITLLEKIRLLGAELGRTPGIADFRKARIHQNSIVKFFGGLRSAQARAGLKPNMPGIYERSPECRASSGERMRNANRISDEVLLKKLAETTRKLGYKPKITRCKEDVGFEVATYVRHFGSLKNAFVLAEVSEFPPAPRKKRRKNKQRKSHAQ